MVYQFYSEKEFKWATATINTDPREAERRLIQYIGRWDKDRSAYIAYARILILLDNLDEAEITSEKIEKLIRDARDENRDNPDSIYKDEDELLGIKIRILGFREKYEELYEFYNNNFWRLKSLDEDIESVMFWCKKQLGLLDSTRRVGHSYKFRQIIQYSESDFREHIKGHLSRSDDTRDLSYYDLCAFGSEFPLEKILEEIKKQIPNSNRLNPNSPVNKYVFKYPRCGKVDGKVVDYFQVIAFHNTSDILTMYPSPNDLCKSQPYIIDLSQLEEAPPSSPYSKKLRPEGPSRIDRFNKRFGLK